MQDVLQGLASWEGHLDPEHSWLTILEEYCVNLNFVKGTSLNYFLTMVNNFFGLSFSILFYLSLPQSILDHFGLSRCISVHIGLFRSILIYLGLSRSILVHLGLFLTISDYLRLCLTISDYLDCPDYLRLSGTIWDVHPY